MIKLKVIKGLAKNQFVIESDEPVTITYSEGNNGHTIAYVYKGINVDEYSEPVGAFDSAVPGVDWAIE
jgi:hypothetical protein